MSSVTYWKNQDLTKYVKYNTVKKNCIVCGSKEFSSWAKTGPWSAVRCDRCGFIWMRPFLTQEGLSQYYTDYIGRRIVDREKMRQRAKQYKLDAKFIEHYVDRGAVLDIGCNGGFFLAEFNNKFKKYGTEIDPDSVAYARKHYSFGKNIHCVDVLDAPFRNGSFNLAVMRGVIEHVPDPHAVMKKTSQLLKKGGYLYITATPNGDSFVADLFREHWNLFDPIAHLWHFSPKTLSTIAKRYGLKMIAADFPYLGTPYERVEQDLKEVVKARRLVKAGKRKKLSMSPPFWGNMMSLVFEKVA